MAGYLAYLLAQHGAGGESGLIPVDWKLLWSRSLVRHFLTVSFPCGFLSYLVVICCCLTIFRYAFVNQYLSFFELFPPLLLLCFYSHLVRLCRVLLIDLSIPVGAIDLVLTCNLTWTQVFPLFSYFLH